MSRKLTIGQINELIQIDAARGGIREEVQELIARLTAGGVGTPDTAGLFRIQSKVLYDLGWGRELGIKTLEAYRQSLEQEGLPVEPVRPDGMPGYLNRLVLWDTRPLRDGKKVSLVKTCRLLGVRYDGDDTTFIQHEGTPEVVVPVRWIWCHDGRRNQNRTPADCRQSTKAPEFCAEAFTGLFLYAQDRSVIGGEGPELHAINLPGSVHRFYPSVCACVGPWDDGPELCWDWVGSAYPQYGSAVRWE